MSTSSRKKLSAQPSVFVRLFAEEGARILARHCDVTRCVNATRVCLEVMRAFHVRAEPLSVDALAVNRAWLALTTSLGRDLGHGPETAEETRLFQKAGAWAVGFDTEPRSTDNAKNVWPGHLVAIVQKEWIVDAAAIQMSRPHKHIAIPDVFVGHAPKAFLKGKSQTAFESGEGARLVYQARLEDRSWETLSGFRPHEHNLMMAREIVLRMRSRLAGKSSESLAEKDLIDEVHVQRYTDTQKHQPRGDQ